MDARKNRLKGADALQAVADSNEIIACRGAKVVRIAYGARARDDALAVLLGPTGNLRAPAFRAGDRFVVGFHEDAYDDVFGPI